MNYTWSYAEKTLKTYKDRQKKNKKHYSLVKVLEQLGSLISTTVIVTFLVPKLAYSCVLNIPEEKVIIKSRKRQVGDTQYTKLEERNELIVVKEYDAEFLVNLHDYLDTGLFLDHRPLRQIIAKSSEGKKVLNLFSQSYMMKWKVVVIKLDI